MRRVREVLRLNTSAVHSGHQIAAMIGISRYKGHRVSTPYRRSRYGMAQRTQPRVSAARIRQPRAIPYATGRPCPRRWSGGWTTTASSTSAPFQSLLVGLGNVMHAPEESARSRQRRAKLLTDRRPPYCPVRSEAAGPFSAQNPHSASRPNLPFGRVIGAPEAVVLSCRVRQRSNRRPCGIGIG
jgi:hypothetical protein